MMIDESATGPLSLPVVVNKETKVDVRWEATLAVDFFVVGCGCPAGWLVHFFDFSCSPKSLRRPNTSSSLARASGIDLPNEITSSR